ncbi:MAG TPA: excinuclease ABC subunit UvrC [Longimicrobiaceae bacterium]|nr:excinuclease ABC subunit UvrC [Longimicrobiaceae bacterium]
MAQSEIVEEKLRHLPTRPGVYLMKDEAGEILYVGKAKSLRSRVRSYFKSDHPESLKTRELVKRVRDFETIVVNSEAEALILENNLIKEHQPRFNINLRDDKTYPYVKVTVGEPIPRVLVTRRMVRDGSRYFGPYTDVRKMRHLLDAIRRIYTLRSCHYRLPDEAPARPCLDHHIGRCKAPCVGLQSEDDYREMVGEVVEVLSGHTQRAAARIRAEMARAAEEMHFERAAELRDALAFLDSLDEQQHVVDMQGADRDVVALARDGAEACGVVMKVREGKLLGRETQFLSNLDGESDADVLATFATRHYTVDAAETGTDLPPEVLFSTDFDDRELLETVLRERAGRAVNTHVPQRGEKVRIVELAEQNARHLLEERRLIGRAALDRAPDTLYELQEVLELTGVPRFIVCFDISHTQGSETVASVSALTNGRPDKSEYRRLRIKGDWGNDDFRSMNEAVARYFRRRLEEEKALPDLVVVDGGKGQLGAARAALESLDLAQQPVVSLAKREEEVFLPGRPDPLRLPRRSDSLRMLQRIRDEAHRFAITYNRKLRTKRTIHSELSEIPGVGASRQRALLERFGSVRGLRSASLEEIAGVPGFGPALARTVREHLQRSGASAHAGATKTRQ